MYAVQKDTQIKFKIVL